MITSKAPPYRVLYLAHPTRGVGSGAGRSLTLLVSHLSSEWVDSLIATDGKGGPYQLLREAGVETVEVNLPPWRKVRSMWKIPVAVLRLARLIKERRIHLLHCNDFWYAPYGWFAARLAGIPCVAHVRSEITPLKMRQYLLHRMDRVCLIAESFAKIARKARVPHIAVIPNGFDLNRISKPVATEEAKWQLGIEENHYVIGVIANISPVKGIPLLIESVRVLRHSVPNIVCLLIGNTHSEYAKQLQAEIRSSGFSDVVRFTGYQPDVFPFLFAMDVFVLPSLSEGFPNVLIEAMAIGKPVVATRVGAIPEMIQHGVTGMLVPPKDSKRLAEAIKTLLMDPFAAHVMGKAGQQYLMNCFPIENTVTQVQTLYRELLEGYHKL